EPVAGGRIEVRIVHRERRVIQRQGVAGPGDRTVSQGGDAGEGGLPEGWVSVETRAADQVRLTGEVAEVVVEAAGAGVGPMDDLRQCLETVRLVRKLPQGRELLLQPRPVVERD